MVRQIFTGAFGIIRENTTFIITEYTIYNFIHQLRAYSMNSEPICMVQFYDSLNISNFLTHISMSNNIRTISKYFPNYEDTSCRWLAGSTFEMARLNPKFVYEKLVQIENNTVIMQ